MAQKLLTKAILKLLPALYATSELEAKDVRVPLKLFNPCGGQSWFITEFDGEDQMFGYVTGAQCDELGYFSLSEFQNTRLSFNLKIERDIHWNPKNTLQQVKDGDKE
jgi:hypothetical protein